MEIHLLMVISTFLTVVGLFIYYKLTLWKRLNVPYTLEYSIKIWQMSLFQAEREVYQKCIENGKAIGMYEMLTPSLLVGDASMAKEILVKRFGEFPDRRFYSGAKIRGSTSTFLCQHDEWKPLRQIQNKIMCKANLKANRSHLDDALDRLDVNLQKFAQSTEPCDMTYHMFSFGLDVMSRYVFGSELGNEEVMTLYKWSRELFGSDASSSSKIAYLFPSLISNGAINFILNGFPLNRNAFTKFCDFVYAKFQKEDGSKSFNFRKFMEDAEFKVLGSSIKLSQTQMVEQAITIFLGGHETLGNFISAVLYYLSLNDSVQDKLISEVKSLSEEDSKDWNVIQSLPYLNVVMKETLRLYPMSRIERRAMCDTEVQGINIPAGTLINIPSNAIFNDPQNVRDPESFQPERFLETNRDAILDDFIAFGAGPRMCPGHKLTEMVSTFVLVRIMRKYRFHQPPGAKGNLEFYKFQLAATPREMKLTVSLAK